MREEALEQLGLSDKETKTYLAALNLGSASAQEIAKKAGLKRPTAYFAIERLSKLGLISSFEKGKKRYFSAESPERLLYLITGQRRKVASLEEDFRRVLPELNNIFKMSGEQPRVRFFEGREGIISIQQDILKSKFLSIEEFVPLDEAYKIFPPASKDHRRRIQKRFSKIPRKVIYSSRKGKILPAKEGKLERRFISPSRSLFSGELVIYGTKTAIVTYKGKLIGIIIESREIADTLRTIFNLAWVAAGK